nr:MAG TPA: Protein of unknown function (DUF551) [Caudoviricetes sp.]
MNNNAKNESASGWISVKEKLPWDDDCEFVLAYSPDCYGSYYVACLDGEGNFYSFDSLDYIDNVTHWMKLPEPPKGE